jgi:hypothetical protein
MVFDNRRAATMFHHIPHDSASAALYLAHVVGAYVKNDAAKMNGFNIMLDGINGSSTMVQFTNPEEAPHEIEGEPEDATTPKRFTGRLGPNAVFTSEASMHAAMQLIINHVADDESLAPAWVPENASRRTRILTADPIEAKLPGGRRPHAEEQIQP